MFVFLRRLVIRTAMPMSWRLRRGRAAAALSEFAATEADSGWQFLRAMDCLPSPAHRALMFHNLLEEREHAAGFDALVKALPGGGAERAPAPREALLTGEADLPEFLAYAYAGELDISLEFGSFARAAGSVPAARALFDAIRVDEDGHHHTLWRALQEAVPDEAEAQALVRKARRRRIWKVWLKFSKRIGDAFLGLWLTLVYAVFGLLLVIPSRRRLRRRALPATTA